MLERQNLKFTVGKSVGACLRTCRTSGTTVIGGNEQFGLRLEGHPFERL
jgi:hypothetical protein